MSSLAPDVLYTKLLLRLGKAAKAEGLVSRGLDRSPSRRRELDLRWLEARIAAELGDVKRTHAALERGFALVDGDMKKTRAVRGLRYLFDRIAGGVIATLRSAKIGPTRLLFVSGSKGRVRLIGLCTNMQRDWAKQPVKLFFEDHVVSETNVLAIEGSGNRGQFEFRIKRSMFTDLGANAVSFEVGGERYPLPSKRFGAQWPTEFKRNPASSSELIGRLKRGYKLDRGGLLVLPKNINEGWLTAVFGLYDRARAWFKANYDYELYPVGGTLLGYAREGGVISFDNDFDTAYMSKLTNPDDIRREYKEIVIGLLKDGVDVQILTSSNPPKVRRDYLWYGDGKTHIDIFVGAFINGKYRRPTFVDTQLTPDDFFPFQTGKMNGREILVPKNLEKKVAAVYGPGWRTPDPLWKKIRTPEILAYRERISLTAEDLLEVAAVSQREGMRLRQLVESGELE